MITKLKYFETRRAQVIPEYAITFFLIVAVISAMSMMVKRALQGRIYEARNTMIRVVNAESPVPVPLEYEPYYMETRSEVRRNSSETVGLRGGTPPGVATKDFLEKTEANTQSVQFPPKEAK